MDILFEFTEYVITGIAYFFAGLLVLILIAIIFGDSIQWKYEAEGYCEACENGKLAVVIKSTKRKGQVVEIEGILGQAFRSREIRLLLKGSELTVFSSSENHQASKRRVKRLSIGEPSAGDVVSVAIDGREIFSQKLWRD